MITTKLIRSALLRKNIQSIIKTQTSNIYGATIIGNRDVVGFGVNGTLGYVDTLHSPFPSVRFRENTPDILALREKEKGDWKKLSIDEKKKLYRASFCQTFAEFTAPTGEWKSIVGIALFIGSFSLWIYMGLKLFILPPLPESCSEENRRAQFRRLLDMRWGRIEGLSSWWDFEKDDWKK